MIKKWLQAFDQYYIFKYLIKWFFLTIPVSLAVGSAVALFLWLLDLATQFRWAHSWLLYLLPFAGVAIVALYKTKGKNTDAGTNLVMDEIHKPGGGIPFRMAPFVLITTVVTHLFGGSAGREGTAVQIGGSMAHYLGKIMKLSKEDLSILLTTGVAAGFGAVFGTPVAGAIFAIEVITIGHLKYNALLPSLLAAISADFICNLYGTQHTHYLINFDQQVSTFELFNMSFDYKIIIWVVIASVIFGIAGNVFSELSHATKAFFKKYVKNDYLIPVIGGLTIIILAYVLQTFDYLGLGVVTQNGEGVSIVNAFKPGGAETFSWLWKIIFTVITLSTGFKGGEVTPLFFIGATLGNTIASASGMPVDLFAALGFIAVFAGATNTPLACTIMGVELFGGEHVIYFAVACFLAYYFSGHSGIYTSQRIGTSKANLTYSENIKQFRDNKRK